MSRLRFLFLILLAALILGAVFFFLSGREVTTYDFAADNGKSALSESASEDAASQTEPAPSHSGTTTEDVFLEILPSDCQNECTSFASEPDKERYCRNVCGLTTDTPGNSPDSIAPYQESIERKDAAIKSHNLGACSEIKDANLRKSCEVRVTEDLLE